MPDAPPVQADVRLPHPPGSRNPMRWLVRAIDQTLDALATGPVMEGVFGSFLLVLGSLTPAFLPRASQGGDLIRVPWLGAVVVVAGCALLLDAWFRLRPARCALTRKGKRPRYLAVLVLWSAPLIFAPPILSGDAYAYAAQGWLLTHGQDPYQMGPGALPSSWADQVDPIWLETPSPYGPISLFLQYLTTAAVGENSAYAAAWGMRLWAVLGTGLLAWSVPRIATRLGKDPAKAVWIGVLNPLVLMHFVGGSHNDALMMGLLAFAIWLATGRHLFAAAVLVGLAAGVKQPAAMAVVAITVLALRPEGASLADEPGRSRRWPTARQIGHCVLALIVIVATFVLVSIVTGMGFGWIQAVNVPGGAITLSPSTQVGLGLQLLLTQFGWETAAAMAMPVVRNIVLVAAMLVLVWLALRVAAAKPITYLVAGLAVVVIGGPALHAWYLLWPGIFAGLLPYRSWVWRGITWLTAFWVGYAAGDVAIRVHTPVMAVVAALVTIGVVVWHEWISPLLASPREPSET